MSEGNEKSKYTMFRNYMANDLGIGRDDIKEWTMLAVQKEAEKIVGQINIQELVDTVISNATNPHSRTMQEAAGKELATQIMKKVKINFDGTQYLWTIRSLVSYAKKN